MREASEETNQPTNNAKSMNPTAKPAAPPTRRVFNDDLLNNEGDLEYAKEQFPRVFQLLDHPELREQFRVFEAAANRARGIVRFLGLMAVACGAVALLSTAAEPFLHGIAGKKLWSTAFELLTIAAAIISGMSLLLGPWRKRWLEARFMTERLRQWHFQLLVRKGAEIEEAFGQPSPEKIQHFQAKRKQWLGEFLHEHLGKLDSQFTLLANDPDDASGDWLLNPKTKYADNSHILADICEAYYRLRIKHQFDYATHKLSEDQDKPHWRFLSWPVLRQEAAIRSVVSFCFYAALFCSVAVIVNQWLDFRPAYAPHLGGLALMVAIVGVAFRTVQDGLGISKDIERYRDYRGKTRRLRVAFENEPDLHERLEVMEELEIESVDELRGFLRTHREAAFVL